MAETAKIKRGYDATQQRVYFKYLGIIFIVIGIILGIFANATLAVACVVIGLVFFLFRWQMKMTKDY